MSGLRDKKSLRRYTTTDERLISSNLRLIMPDMLVIACVGMGEAIPCIEMGALSSWVFC